MPDHRLTGFFAPSVFSFTLFLGVELSAFGAPTSIPKHRRHRLQWCAATAKSCFVAETCQNPMIQLVKHELTTQPTRSKMANTRLKNMMKMRTITPRKKVAVPMSCRDSQVLRKRWKSESLRTWAGSVIIDGTGLTGVIGVWVSFEKGGWGLVLRKSSLSIVELVEGSDGGVVRWS